MLFCSKTMAGTINDAAPEVDIDTIDSGKIILGGGFRLPVRTLDIDILGSDNGFCPPNQEA